MANYNDVARLANVSRQTVSRVINNSGSVSDKARKRVLEAISQLGYYPNLAARSLKSAKSKTIGFIIPDSSNDFFIKTANLLQRKFNARGYSLLILFSDEDEQTEEKCLSTLIENRIELLLFTPTSVNSHFVSLLDNYNIKAIQLFRHSYDDLVSISFDDVYGGYLAASHLLDKGHRRFLLAEEYYPFESSRLRGLKESLIERSIKYDASMYLCIKRSDHEIDLIKNALISRSPTAVIAVAKSTEIALMKAVFELHLEVHKDIDVVFYDDNEIAEFFEINTIAHDHELITDTIVDSVMNHLDGNMEDKKITLKPHLLQRQA